MLQTYLITNSLLFRVLPSAIQFPFLIHLPLLWPVHNHQSFSKDFVKLPMLPISAELLIALIHFQAQFAINSSEYVLQTNLSLHDSLALEDPYPSLLVIP